MKSLSRVGLLATPRTAAHHAPPSVGFSRQEDWSGVPRGTGGKENPCQCRRLKRHRFDPWIRNIRWRRAWPPTPVSLPGEAHGQRSLVGYSPCGHKESDMSETLSTSERVDVMKLPLQKLKCCMKTAAAELLQSCPTLCDPIDSSPPGSPVPGILQARTLEWVAISFSNT